MNILALLFGTPARVRMMRLFVFNPHAAFTAEEVGERTQAFPSYVRNELIIMQKMGLIKKKPVVRAAGKKQGIKAKNRRLQGYMLDEHFPYLRELESLITNTVPLKSGYLMQKLQSVGRLKLIIVAGIFTEDPDSRVDLLIVGDNIRKSALENAIKFIEAEIGKELRYAAFETTDFHYRLSVYDKLIKDILDYPHHKVLDKLNVK